MSHFRFTLDGALAGYLEGLLSNHDFVVAVTPHVSVETIDRIMAAIELPAKQTVVEVLTSEQIGLAEPSPADVARVHAAMRAWLNENPELMPHAAPGFDR